MALLPVVTREMSVLARRQSTYWARAVTAIIAVLTMLWLALVSASRVSVNQLGSSIFLVLSTFSFVFALLAGVQATSDSLSEEKREGTLGLLFLTPLRGLHIVLGKMAASSLNALFALLGVVPMLSLALLLGGVAAVQIAQIAVVLLNAMFLSLAMGVFVSSLSRNERKAMFACFVSLFAITILPFGTSFALNGGGPPIEEVVWVSPLYSFFCSQGPTVSVGNSYFIRSLLLHHLLAWALLLSAGAILPRFVNELPSRRFARWRAFVENYIYGTRLQRERYRALLLDQNAFLWLASRERVKPKYAWGIVVAFGLFYFWVAHQFPNMFLDPPVSLTMIFLVQFILKIWTASEVCSRLINDRRSGALELLLSTPLSVREIAEGQSLALQRIFRGPVRVLIAAGVFILISTLRDTGQEPAEVTILYLAAMSTFLLDLWALKWVGLWLSLFGKSIERVLLASLVRILAVPWLLFAVIAGTASAIIVLQNTKPPENAYYIFWWLLSLAVSCAFGFAARANFFRYFRDAAAQRFDARALSPAVLKKMRRAEEAAAEAKVPALTALRWIVQRHWFLSGSTVVLGLILLACAGRQWYWSRQLAAELEQIRLAQQPANLAELGRIYAPPPTGGDAFARLRDAGAVNWGRWLQPNFAAMLFARLDKSSAGAAAECQKVLSNNQAQISAFRALPRYHKAYIDPNSGDFWGFPVDLRGYVALGTADLILAISAGDPERIRSDLRSLLRLTELLRAQPVVEVQNFCQEALSALDHAFENLLPTTLLSTEDLLDFQVALEKIDQANVFTRTLSVERAKLIDRWGKPDPRFPMSPPVFVAAANGLYSAVGSQNRQLVLLLRTFEKARRAAPRSRATVLAENGASVGSGSGAMTLMNAMLGGPQFNLATMMKTEASITGQLALLQSAVAAERFRRRHGTLPATPSDLVPEYLDRLPIDSLTGDPLEFESSPYHLRIQLPASRTDRTTFELRRARP